MRNRLIERKPELGWALIEREGLAVRELQRGFFRRFPDNETATISVNLLNGSKRVG